MLEPMERIERDDAPPERDLSVDTGIRRHLEAAWAAHKPANPDVDLVRENVKEAHDAIQRAGRDGKDVKRFDQLHPNDRRHLQVRDAYTREKLKADTPVTKLETGQPMHDGPPGVWDSNAKAEWEKLPPAVRTSVLREQNENLRLLEQATPMMKKYSELDRVIAPHREILPKDVTEPEAIGNMLQWARLVHPSNPNKAAGMAMLMAQQGVTLQDVYNVVAQAQQQPDQQQPQQYEQQYQPQQQQEAEVAATLKSFAADPRHRHFETVRVSMGTLLQGPDADRFMRNGKEDLEALYREACRLHGIDDSKDKRSAAVSPSTRSPSGQGSNPGKASGIRGHLQNAFAEARGRM